MAIIVGEYYRLKSTPNYSWVKVLRILKPNNSQNKNRFVVVECEHSVNKNDTFGFVRLFRLHEILPNKACSRLIVGGGNLPAEKSYSKGSAPAKSG